MGPACIYTQLSIALTLCNGTVVYRHTAPLQVWMEGTGCKKMIGKEISRTGLLCLYCLLVV